MRKINTSKQETYEFGNITELMEFISKPIPGGRDNSSESGGSDFTKTSSIDEAKQMLTLGNKQLHNDLISEGAKLKDTKKLLDGIKRTFTNDVVGFMPNVALAVMGVPNNMIRQHRKVIKQKILNISINISVSGMVSASDILKNAAILYSAVNSLEAQGYRCNVWVTEVTRSGRTDKEYVKTLRVKTDKEPFNQLKMAFPIAHPSMLRRIFFAVDERMDTWVGSGYGTPIHGENAEKLVKQAIGTDQLIHFDVMKLRDIGISGIESRATSLVYEEYKRGEK